MTIATHDTQHGATLALSTDSQTLLITSISPAKRTIPVVPSSNHATATNETSVAGDLAALAPIPFTYQNGPSQAALSVGTTQTLTITGPVPSGASTGEIMSITGFISEAEDSPQYDAASGTSAALQVKTAVFQPDGTTFTHTVAAI